MEQDASTYRLGVDVGGTFTDLLLIREETGEAFTAKVPSTPKDPSQGVLNGIAKICARHKVDPTRITHVMHGTTVATNTVLEGNGARVGLVTTLGYRQVLQIARSFVPGGLGGWVIFNKRPPLAPLELTIEVEGRLGTRGEVIVPLNEAQLREKLRWLAGQGIEALTVSLINAYADGCHEVRVREIAAEVIPEIPVSISSEVIPEMSEYERTETTVVNSYIRPKVARYLGNLHNELIATSGEVKLRILRSDGGLASVEAAADSPINLLMSGPAGGVAGAIWLAKQAGFENLLTFDMGGTSTDVALIQDSVAQTRRETRVADVTVRAPSIDVRTVGAGGGSIAYVPELTRALRVGPQSAGAVPGPAAYALGGDLPTVTDANVVLGYLPARSRLGGDMELDVEAARRAMQGVADRLGMSVLEAAEGVIKIVNENMFGALRIVSIERGYDPRDFALVAFGGAGPLHANAIGRLLGAWPVVIPPAPGVLCAYGDATTRLRDEASRTFIRRLDETSDAEVQGILDELAAIALLTLQAEGIPEAQQSVSYEIDLRYRGQITRLTVATNRAKCQSDGLAGIAELFDRYHEQLYTFTLDVPRELVNLRVIVEGPETRVRAESVEQGGTDATAAIVDHTEVFIDGMHRKVPIFDRANLCSGNRIEGPAVVCQMDTTTLILPEHHGEVDTYGNILIRPNVPRSAD